ncbi:MAG TPA: hypothetical protein PLC98_20640 [Anaerolineales bacterium]|nr:hypothetical protein [Anaerolineales bacterium]
MVSPAPALPTAEDGLGPLAARFQILVHREVEIAVIDLSYIAPDDALPLLRRAGALIIERPLRSVRALTDVTGGAYNKEGLALLKEFAVNNTPYILASAVVGATGLRVAALRAVALVTGRHIRPFETREEALDWLASIDAS